LLVAKARPEVALQRSGQEADVLHVDRPVEAQLAPQRRQLVDGGVARQHRPGRVPGEPQRREDERDDAERDQQGVEELSDGVAEHALGSVRWEPSGSQTADKERA
jgi:hypothetical protein